MSTSSTTSTTLQSGCFQDWGDGTIRDTCTNLQWEKKTTTVGSGVNAADLHDVDNRYEWAGRCSTATEFKYCQPNLAAETACKAQTDVAYWGSGCEQCVGNEGTCDVKPYGSGGITTIWDWLSQVNMANYAGHNDWRLPSESGCNTCWDPERGRCAGCLGPSAHEFETILLEPYPCVTRPCIDSIFGPTASAPQDSFYWSSSTIGGYPPYAWLVEFSEGKVLTGGGEAGNSRVRAVRGGS